MFAAIASRVKSLPLRPWRELALLALLVMEISWIALLFTALIRRNAPGELGKVVPFLSVLYFGAYFLGRALSHYQVKVEIRRWVIGLLGLLTIKLAIDAFVDPGDSTSLLDYLVDPRLEGGSDAIVPPQFWVILAILLIWLRSLRLGRLPVGSELSINSFKFGMVMWVVIGILSTIRYNPASLGYLFVYMFAGLISMSAARFSELSGMRGGRQVRFHQSWLAGIGATTLIILAFGFFVSAILQGQLGAIVEGLFLLAFAAVGILMALLIAPLVILFLLIIPLMEEWFSDPGLMQGIQRITGLVQGILEPVLTDGDLSQVLQVLWASRLLILAAILVVVAVVILVALRILNRREPTGTEDERESLLESGDLLRMLREALQRRLNNLAARLRGRGISDARRLLAAMRIRWIYAHLMDIAARLGTPRPPAVTPLEFLPALDGLFPEESTELNAITNAYLQVRYGEVPESEQDLAAINDAWEKVQRSAHVRLAEMKKRSRMARTDE